jgi:hypothetical protein
MIRRLKDIGYKPSRLLDRLRRSPVHFFAKAEQARLAACS